MRSSAWLNALVATTGYILIDTILIVIVKRKELLSMTSKDVKRKIIAAIFAFFLFLFLFSR